MMSDPQAIIMYRNPIEANFYSALLSGDLNGVFLALLVMVLVVVGLAHAFEKLDWQTRNRYHWVIPVAAGISFLGVLFGYPWL